MHRDFEEFPQLTPVESERRATLMDSIRQTGGVGRIRLRTAAESEERLRQFQASAAARQSAGDGGLGPGGRGRGGAGRGDLMRDLSAQLRLRGRAAPIRTRKR